MRAKLRNGKTFTWCSSLNFNNLTESTTLQTSAILPSHCNLHERVWTTNKERFSYDTETKTNKQNETGITYCWLTWRKVKMIYEKEGKANELRAFGLYYVIQSLFSFLICQTHKSFLYIGHFECEQEVQSLVFWQTALQECFGDAITQSIAIT